MDLVTSAIITQLEVSIMQIQPFSLKAQLRLTQRWLNLDPELKGDPEKYSEKEAEAMKLIGSIIGNGYIPPFPPYLLAILQSLYAGQPVSETASTHGHLYEAFINSALAKRRSAQAHRILKSFAGFLAFKMFLGEQEIITHDEITKIHSDWIKATDLNRDLQTLLTDLVQVRFLRRDHGVYRFGEKFILYYFVALYIQKNLNDPEPQQVVSDCVKKVWVEDYANVLLFLAHLSNDETVINQLLSETESYFSESPEEELRGTLSFEGKEITSGRDAIDHGNDSDTELQAISEEQKLQQLPSRLDRSSSRGDLDFLGQLCAAVKVLQILGQFVKNFPDNFKPDKKVEIVRNCVGIGLRALKTVFDLVSDEKVDIIEAFAKLISRGDKSKLNEARKEAETTLAGLCLLNSFGLLKAISSSVGSRELERTYEKVFKECPDTPSWILVELSIKLDHVGNFPSEAVLSAYKGFIGGDMKKVVFLSFLGQQILFSY